MRFQLCDTEDGCSWRIVDDGGYVVFESSVSAPREEVLAELGRAIDALRDPRRYRSAPDGGLILVDSGGEQLARARVPRGMSVGEFVEERHGDAVDRERFRVEEVGDTPPGEPLLAPGRDELVLEYDYSVTGFPAAAGVNESPGGAPFRFLYRDEGGRGIVYSRDYDSPARLRSATRALLRAAHERYVDRWREGGRFYFRVVDGRGWELGRSPGFATAAIREKAVAYFLATAGRQREDYAPPPRDPGDDYPVGWVSATGAAGFEEFRHPDSGRYYFAFNDDDGTPLLLSRSYRDVRAQLAGLMSVMRHGARVGNYRIRESGGRYAVVLLAGASAELARTRTFPSEPEAARYRDYLLARLRQQADEAGVDDLPPRTPEGAVGPPTHEFEISRPLSRPVDSLTEHPQPDMMAHDPNPARREDNYLVCSAYKARIGDSRHARHEDVVTFTHDNGLHYFALLTDAGDGIALRSEGYPTVGARETGLKSVLRFREKRARFKLEEMRGMYFTVLTAQNGQEIARSCPKGSAAEAEALWPAMSAASAALAARAAQEAAAREVAAAPAEGHDPNPARREDNYLVCSAYAARVGDSRHPKHDDVVTFQHDNGLFYFATLTDGGEIALRSEGYPTRGARDTGLKSVLRFREKRTRFKTEQRRNLYFTVLYAQNGQEIARSCPKESENAAGALWPALGAASAAALAARGAAATEPMTAPDAERPKPDSASAPTASTTEDAAPPIGSVAAGLAGAAAAGAAAGGGRHPASGDSAAAAPPQPETGADREDDYLSCKEYRGRGLTDPGKRVSLFQHENGLYYFAILNPDDPGVRLRSEGFSSPGQRDGELATALRLLDEDDRYERVSRGNYYINVLRDETGREVGRSCAREEVVPFVAPVGAGAGAGAAVTAFAAAPLVAAGAAAASPMAAAPTAATSTTPPAPPPTAATGPSPATGQAEPTDGGGSRWWVWALAALLLLALLWFLIRACGTPGGVAAGDDAEVVGANATAATAAAAAAATATAAGGTAASGVETSGDNAVDVLAGSAASSGNAAPPPPADADAGAAPAPRPGAGGDEALSCGSIAVDARYNDRGVPELPVDVFDGLAGRIQVFLARESGATERFGLEDLEFTEPGDDLAVAPCSVGDVDRLAAVLRDNPDAVITVSASDPADCQGLAKLLNYRGVDRSRIDVRPSSGNELLVTQ